MPGGVLGEQSYIIRRRSLLSKSARQEGRERHVVPFGTEEEEEEKEECKKPEPVTDSQTTSLRGGTGTLRCLWLRDEHAACGAFVSFVAFDQPILVSLLEPKSAPACSLVDLSRSVATTMYSRKRGTWTLGATFGLNYLQNRS